ncbi:MAG: polysaccharide biosynthesis tyrosine autokinase [Abditibacteriota bacterium]|nr:polysaccharide biosynthesis tyrosine autokinase [Abditibacteriota bacterium]
MELWRYIKIIKRRWWLVVLGMIVCVSIVGYKLWTAPTFYVGRTTIQEALGSAHIGVPIYQSQLMQTQMDLQQRLSNLSNLATSREVMTHALDLIKIEGLDVEKISSHTKVSAVKDTNIIAIEVTLENSDQAKVAAGAIAEAFKEYYGEITNQAITNSRIFISNQLIDAKNNMDKAQNDMRKFKEQTGIVQLDTHMSGLVQRLNNAKIQNANDKSDLASAVSSLNQVSADLKKLEPNKWEKNSETVSRNPQWERLTSTLTELETQRAGMISGGPNQARRGPNHPDVLDLDRKIEEVKVQLADSEMMNTSATTTAKNGNYSATFDRYVTAKVEAAAAEARAKASGASVDSVEEELLKIPSAEAELARLTTDLKAASETYYTLLSKFDEAKIRERQAKNESALITIDPPYTTIKNNRAALKLGLAICLSPLLGILAALLLYYLDSRIRNTREAEKLLGMQVLAAVPMTAKSFDKMNGERVDPGISEAFHTFTPTLWMEMQNNKTKTYMVTSTKPSAGSTTVAINTAVALAGEGARVILVDGNMRNPAVAQAFGITKNIGFINLLSETADLEDVAVPTSVHGLLVVPAGGPQPQNPVQLICGSTMKTVLDEMAQAADFVIIDTPSASAASDALLMASKIQAAIVVQAANVSDAGKGVDIRDKFESTSTKLMGAVLNKVRQADLEIDTPAKKI